MGILTWTMCFLLLASAGTWACEWGYESAQAQAKEQGLKDPEEGAA
jgi:hypothetical protein